MADYKLDRRRTLSSGLALASACMLSRRVRAATVVTGQQAADIGDAQALENPRSYTPWYHESPEQWALYHAPFQAEFLAWLAESADRFALPVSAKACLTSTEFHAAGLHPALMINLQRRSCSMSVLYNRRCVGFDGVSVDAEEIADGAGWRNTVLLPQAQRIHATRHACWREDCFEVFLDWFNNDLVPATHAALYGEVGDDEFRWHKVRLLRDGRDSRTGRPAPALFLRALLPLPLSASTAASDMTAPGAHSP